MKIRLLSVLTAALLLNACVWDDSDTAQAKQPTASTQQPQTQPIKREDVNRAPRGKSGSVSYACEQNKHVDVVYHFDAKGAPTNATAMINGKAINMPVNAKRSDPTGVAFGQISGYRMSTNPFTMATINQSHIILTAPNNNILFKNCEVK